MGQACASRGTPESKNSKRIDEEMKKLRSNEDRKVKLLLLGPGESGKSTIFKQMKIIQYRGGFSDEEKLIFVHVVHTNCITPMRLLLTAMQDSNVELSLPINEAIQVLNTDNFTPEVGRWISVLWKNEVVQEYFQMHQKTLQLNDSAPYFFEQVDRISDSQYIPSHDDILRARLRSTGIEEADFKFEDLTFIMIDVGGQRSERRKWIHCFDNVNAIIFVASLSCYDQFLREDVYQNSMLETLLLFQEVANSFYFKSNKVILFLNKSDLFEQKIAHAPLSGLFPEYKGGSDKEKGLSFIRQKFTELSPTKMNYVHITCALDTVNIKHVINDVKIVLLEAFVENITMIAL